MVRIAKDLEVVLQNRPGSLAHASEAIAKTGANIEGLCGFPVGATGIAHFLFATDPTTARRALEQAGHSVHAERDVVVVEVEDQPGVAAKLFRQIASQDVNVDLVYLATNTRIVIGGSDVPKIREILGAPAVATRS